MRQRSGAGTTRGKWYRFPPFSLAVPAFLAAWLTLAGRAPAAETTSAGSAATTVDTRAGAKLVLLWIVGGQSIPSDASREYHCRALFSDSADIDVTAATKWSVKATVLPPGTAFSGNSLHAGFVRSRQYITITATYTHPGGGETETASLTLAIEPSFTVSFTQSEHYYNPTFWTVDFSADSSGPNGAATTYTWDLDGDGVFGDKTGANVSKLLNAGRSHLVGVKATDSQGNVAIAEHYVTTATSSWAFWADQPVLAVDVVAGAFRDVNGAPYVPDAGRANVGLIIIAHGLKDNSDGWAQEMGRSIVAHFGAATPNVCLFDWRQMADPSRFDTGASGENLHDFLHDILNIEPYALAEGRILATWVNSQITLGNIRSDRPIHLIGHSAGGFVMGECGTIVGSAITQVTMLDTPNPAKRHFTEYPKVGLVERYISSWYGKACMEFVTDDDQGLGVGGGYGLATPSAFFVTFPQDNIATGPHYYRGEIIPMEDLQRSDDQHANSHEWYRTATIEGAEVNGFYYSPFSNHGFHGAAAAQLSAAQAASPTRVALGGVITEEPIAGFGTFGTVTETNGSYTVTEAYDAGLLKQMTMPIGAQSLRFRFQFTSPGDGDFLAVYWGSNNPVLYIGLDLDLSRAAFEEVDAPVEQYAGQSNQLAFVLTSRGDTNAVLVLDQIRLSLSDDPDNDGVSTTNELAAGTAPLKNDTDGDAVSDGDEMNVYHTNPLLVDSDGDGVPDGVEIRAGTAPNDSNSVFRITGMAVQTNATLDLQWSGGTDRFYRVNSASSPRAGAYKTLINNVADHQVTVPNPAESGTNTAGFFWIELDDAAGQ